MIVQFIYFYLFERARANMRGSTRGRKGQAEREKQTLLWAGSPMWGVFPGPWDHDPMNMYVLWLSSVSYSQPKNCGMWQLQKCFCSCRARRTRTGWARSRHSLSREAPEAVCRALCTLPGPRWINHCFPPPVKSQGCHWWLCDLRKIASLLWASISSFVMTHYSHQRVFVRIKSFKMEWSM